MKSITIKYLGAENWEQLKKDFPHISKYSTTTKINEFIKGCKYVVCCGGLIFVVNYFFYNISTENIEIKKINKKYKEFVLSLFF